MRRHVKIHKRTENYNPRQRKLRNVVVQELDGNPAEGEAVQQGSLVPEEVPEPEVDPRTELGAGCIVNVVIDSADVVMGPDLAHMEAAEALTMPEVLQQSEIVAEAFESTMGMAAMVERISETKS